MVSVGMRALAARKRTPPRSPTEPAALRSLRHLRRGENNEGTDAGSSLHGSGYGCLLPTMVAHWRRMWSLVPGTTDPDASFGIITIADGTEEGNGLNAYAMHASQSANFGSLPNPAIENSYLVLAHDAGDPVRARARSRDLAVYRYRIALQHGRSKCPR